MPEVIIPKDVNDWKKHRSRDITSTEVAALFDCNPYLTEFELWHRKKNAMIIDLNQNERMKWGVRLEQSIALGIAEDNGWEIRPMKEYIRDRELRLGASFDFKIEGDVQGILEVKNVDSLAYRDGWILGDDGIEAPPHIEIQVQVQLAVSELKVAYIGALIGGNKVILIKRDPNQNVIAEIKRRVDDFWVSLEENIEPAPDYSKDSAFISQLYGYSSPGKVMDLTYDEESLDAALRYRELGKEIKEKEVERDTIKAQLLRKIGDAEKVIGGKYSISAGLVGPAHVEYDRKGYRIFKINWKREKKL